MSLVSNPNLYNVTIPIMHGGILEKLLGLCKYRLGGKSEPTPSMKTNIGASPQNFSEIPPCMIGMVALYSGVQDYL